MKRKQKAEEKRERKRLTRKENKALDQTIKVLREQNPRRSYESPIEYGFRIHSALETYLFNLKREKQCNT